MSSHRHHYHHHYVPNQIIRISVSDNHSEYSQYSRHEEDYPYDGSYHGLDHEPHCLCYECQGDEDEDEEENPSYDSSDDSSDDEYSLIIRRLSGFRRGLPMHWPWHFNFDRDSVFEDDNDNDGGDGSDSRLHFRLVEAYHNYVSLWLERMEAELRAMGFEVVDV